MNKAELKKFAIEARRDLIEKVSLKAEQYGITKDNIALNIEKKYGQLIVNGREYPPEINHALNTLERRLESIGFEQIIEEVAYTWFNRIIAILYMEVNSYLPERVNILSSTTGKAEPDIFYQYETMNLNVRSDEINALIQEERTAEAYKKLFVAACNSLNNSLPTLFEKINDYTELLLPDYLLDSEFVIAKLITNDDLTENFKEVEVIGWLYQYYNIEPKDKVFEKLRENKKAEKHEIPSVTQFFTPKWIVKYMVENTLGQLWIEAHPNSRLNGTMDFYIEPAEQIDEVKEKIEEIRYRAINLEELKIIDPCVGSGHILTYTFDLLYRMYEESGYLSKDIPSLILEKNLYGLDIDERATQMASFALMMKAREKSKRIMKQNIDLNIFAIEESNDINVEELKTVLIASDTEKKEIDVIIKLFNNAKNFGSAIRPPNINYKKYLSKFSTLGESQLTFDTLKFYNQLDKVKRIFLQAYVLSLKFDVAITNPPYMGTKAMNLDLKRYVEKNYPSSKSDLYAVFLERVQEFTEKNGLNSTITQHSWMFINSFEKIRKKIITDKSIVSLLHLGTKAFDDISGEVVQSVAQTFRNVSHKKYKGTYIRLVNYTSTIFKKDNLKNKSNRYENQSSNFEKIPGSPIAYWASDKITKVFEENEKIEDIAHVKKGSYTGDNKRFLRLWHELNFNKVALDISEGKERQSTKKKWYPYNKGGQFRKWYGNQEYMINWEDDGNEIRNFVDEKGNVKSGIRNPQFYFREGLSWSDVTSGDISVRYFPSGFINDATGPMMFLKEDKYKYILLAYTNSVVLNILSKLTMSTLHFNNGTMAIQPYKRVEDKEIDRVVKENIMISKLDWDSFEVSWNFRKHSLLNERCRNLEEAFAIWGRVNEERKITIKKNERYINKFFINLYELENEISYDEDHDYVSPIQAVNKALSTKTFLSYFMGCLVGRFSLDIEGITYAGGDFYEEKYSDFKPSQDGLIQLAESQYFENDIIVRLKEFLSVAFSEETVSENMKWLAESLTVRKNESSEERLRRYFIDEFFNDHCKTYQKRPIYWLVDSGKQKGLKTFIYMHRYQPDTMATIRFEHLQEIQSKYQNEINMLDIRLANPDLSLSDRKNLEKSKLSYQKKIEELQEFDKKLAVYANEQIDIDLDDGVKVNYAKFDGVLAKIK